MLTKGLSIFNNNYELLVDKLKRLLSANGINKVNISAVGGPCLAAGLANRVHSSVVISNEDIKTAKKIADMLNTSYYHTSFSDDINGVEVSAAIKNIFSMAVGAAKGCFFSILYIKNHIPEIYLYHIYAQSKPFCDWEVIHQ